MLVGCLILISIDFYDFISPFSLVLVSVAKIYQTLKTLFDNILKHLEVRQKSSAVRRIFNSLLSVWKWGET